MLLPPAAERQAAAVLDGLHGLVLAGGADVDPERYGAEPRCADRTGRVPTGTAGSWR